MIGDATFGIAVNLFVRGSNILAKWRTDVKGVGYLYLEKPLKNNNIAGKFKKIESKKFQIPKFKGGRVRRWHV